MNPFLRMALPWIGGAAVVMLLGAGFLLYGAHQYQAGGDARQAEIEKRQAAIERGWQEERDRADANHRGDVLVRQQVEAKLAQVERDRDAAFIRVDGLRKQLAARSTEASRAGGGSDGASPDWIGLFGECFSRTESLGRRLGAVGRDAARWADQVNGLQGYIQGLRGVPSGYR